MKKLVILSLLFLQTVAFSQSNNTGYVVEGTPIDPVDTKAFNPPERIDSANARYFDDRNFGVAQDRALQVFQESGYAGLLQYILSEVERVKAGYKANNVDLTETRGHRAGGAVMFETPRSRVNMDSIEQSHHDLKRIDRFQFFHGLTLDRETVFHYRHNAGFVDFISLNGDANYLQIIRPRNYLSPQFDWDSTLHELARVQTLLQPSQDQYVTGHLKSLMQKQTGFISLTNFIGVLMLEKSRKFPEYGHALNSILESPTRLAEAIHIEFQKVSVNDPNPAFVAAVRDLMAFIVPSEHQTSDLARLTLVTDMQPKIPRTDDRMRDAALQIKREYTLGVSSAKSCRRASKTTIKKK